jgi:SAM-dependent methyltransferase
VRCPRCAGTVDVHGRAILCAGCGWAYPRLGDVPVLLSEPEAYLASCRRQLTLLERQAERTARDIEEQMRAPDALPATRERGLAMTRALRGQLEDVRAILDPLLPLEASRAPAPAGALSDRVPATIEYLHYLFRDWGWPPEEGGENERALATLESIVEGGPLGRTLVLGAGGCRLAYDLHRRRGGARTVAIDIDPLLFAAARSVIRGEAVRIREANLDVGELGQSSREWTLTAPHGPITDGDFHLIVADGVEPPFAPAAFDTVVTPWFLDEGPHDVRDLISVIHRLLAPGGRWLNLGPLLYAPTVPVALRFGREELFDLAARSGFRVDRWRTDSAPYLVSKLNGRGKVEWVLAFSASRLDGPPASDGPEESPPSWLVFGHLPVPAFPDPPTAWSRTVAGRRLIAAVDGRRTLDDIARLIARETPAAGLSLHEIRDAVRQFLADAHPACRGEPTRGGQA